jgi:hypothetical protein
MGDWATHKEDSGSASYFICPIYDNMKNSPEAQSMEQEAAEF